MRRPEASDQLLLYDVGEDATSSNPPLLWDSSIEFLKHEVLFRRRTHPVAGGVVVNFADVHRDIGALILFGLTPPPRVW